ncbi:hypothetical protein ENSA5_06930 [Enhygromyxa salina]|uniref:Uncharacterized protein n=1 Tax=Enhygromyxa salina TaxID=215803 RepID=A0A2S9YHE4_9BACT|nr:hypothetical protein [Enhygromyxa salina]PRQ04527.1 hypothetical protein ENSA5_06930 [Enhygromyxa salina]
MDEGQEVELAEADEELLRVGADRAERGDAGLACERVRRRSSSAKDYVSVG